MKDRWMGSLQHNQRILNSMNGISILSSTSALVSSSSSNNNTQNNLQNQSLIITSIPSNEGPTKALIGLNKMKVTVASVSSSSSSVTVNHNSNQHQGRLPSFRGLHSKNLSYETIYSAPKSTIIKEEHPPSSKSNQVHGGVTTKKRKSNDSENPSKIGQPTNHVFGLRGCDYGHGSIINGMKSIKILAMNPESICSGKSNSRVIEDTCSISRAEQLKAAGNLEYKGERFTKAISFYDKALTLCPNDVGCHNNKATSLSSLGKVLEAI